MSKYSGIIIIVFILAIYGLIIASKPWQYADHDAPATYSVTCTPGSVSVITVNNITIKCQ